jgi:signal transduction histidine kinase
MVECNLKEVIDRILELNQKTIREKEISLNIDIPENQSIYGIPAFLDSIFYNLLSNAFKYGVTRNSRTIELWSEENSNEIRVFVKDMGWGIDLEKHQDKLFKLGSRLHISSDGQGLGLYMTKHQVEELGGKIEIESEVNVGTTFRLSFPKYPKNVMASIAENGSEEHH